MATGRTPSKFFKFQVDDSGGVVRDIPVSTINGVGLDYGGQDMTALQDAIKSVLPEIPDLEITISGPVDNTVVQAASGTGAAPALSGSHTVLSPINGLLIPLTLGVYLGIRAHWATGDPAFGLTSSASSGFLCMSYIVNPADMTYEAKFKVFPGSSVPAWGTAAYT